MAHEVAGRVRPGRRRTVRELSGFLTVGAVCFVVDVGLFQVLYAAADVGAVTAKTFSTVVAMTLAFVGHRSWSFAHRARTDPRRAYLLFVAINATTLAIGAGIVAFVRYPLSQESVLVIQLVNIASIGLTTLVRWASYRRWVFPEATPAQRTASGTPALLPSRTEARTVG